MKKAFRKAVSMLLCLTILSTAFSGIGIVASAAEGYSQIVPYYELDEMYDNFVYVGMDVYEFDEHGEPVLTDYYVNPGDWLEFRTYIKTDLCAGASTIYTLFDKSFFDVSTPTDYPPSDTGYTSGADGTCNPEHPAVGSSGLEATVTSNSATDVPLILRYSDLSEDYLATQDVVGVTTRKNTTENQLAFDLRTDEWCYSYKVQVREDVEESTVVTVDSPDSLWQATPDESTGTYTNRKPNQVRISTENADALESGITHNSCLIMATYMSDGNELTFINDEMSHTFTVGKNPNGKYSIDFFANGGYFHDHDYDHYCAEFQPGENIVCPEYPIKEGYTFMGWSTDPSSPYPEDINVMPEENIQLYAIWEANAYTATWMVDGEEYLCSVHLVDEMITPPEDPTKAGYVFAGWAREDNPDVIIDSYDMVMPWCDVTFVAVFEPCNDTEYTVEHYFMSFEGTFPEISDRTFKNIGTTGEIVTYVPEEYEGFTFNPSLGCIEAILHGDGSTVLKVYYDRNKYEVGINGDIQECYYGEEITEPVFPEPPEGYEFNEWADQEGNLIIFPYVVVEDTYINPVFSPCTYTFVFDSNGGEFSDGSSVKEIKSEYGAPLQSVEPLPTRTGYDFVGWTPEIPETTPAMDMTFRAVWEAVEFNAEWYADGELICVDVYRYGDFLRAPDIPIEKEGYIFAGWAAEENSEAVLDVENMTMPLDGISLYAVYFPASDTTYNLEIFRMNTEGIYELTEVMTMVGTTDTEVCVDAGSLIEEGFTLNVDNSVLTGIIAADGSLMLRVYLDRNVYSVIYDNGLECIQEEYYYGSEINEPETPYKTGYVFDGWVDENGNQVHFPCTVPAEGIRFNAVWKICEYTVRFHAAIGYFPDGETEIVRTMRFGDYIEYPENPYCEGYTFAGWVDQSGNVPEPVMPDNDLDITAQWVINEYTIYFDDGRGHDIESFRAEYDSDISEYMIAPPFLEGYEFVCWFDTASGTEYREGMRMPAQDIRFSAIWQACNYTVTWIFDGMEMEKSIFTFGEPVAHPAYDPEKQGYVFAGWEYEGNIISGSFTMPAKDIVFEARFIAKNDTPYSVFVYEMDTEGLYPVDASYSQVFAAETDCVVTVPVESYIKEGFTVDYDRSVLTAVVFPDGSTVLEIFLARNAYELVKNIDGEEETVLYYYGSIVEEPETPCKVGYVFDRWVNENGDTVDFPLLMPAETIRIYPVWFEEIYELTFNAGGGRFGDGSQTKTFSLPYDAEIEMPEDPAREGYTFIGWVDENNNYVEFPCNATYDMTLQALWQANEYTLTLIANEGTFPDNTNEMSFTCSYGTQLDYYDTPCREGYCFMGWATDESSPYIVQIPSYMPAYDLTLYAVWQVEEYSVRFNDGFGDEFLSIWAEYGEELEIIEYISCPKKDGYIFIGWKDSSTDELISYPFIMPPNDVVLIAEWEYGNYTVTWDADGYITMEEYQVGMLIETPPDPEKTGYTFAGWEDENGHPVEFSMTMPAENVVFRAIWYPNAYTVFFEYSGGCNSYGEPYTEITCLYGEEIYESDMPTKEGCIFMGWEDEYGYPVQFPMTMPANDIVIRATWMYEVHRITFDNGFGSEIVVFEYTYGDAIEPIEPAPVEGYTFAGWEPYIPDTMPACDLHFVAVWVPNFYTVTWNVDGVMTNTVFEYGQEISIPPTPTKEGYLFAGWTPYVPETMPAHDLEFTATWESAGPVTYTVETYKMNTFGIYEKSELLHSTAAAGDVSVTPVIPEGFVLNEQKSVVCGYADMNNELVLEVYLDRIPYKFTKNINGKAFTTEYLYGSIIAEPAAPSKDGYIFIGWEGEIPLTMPANDVTITAKFREVTPEDNVEYEISLHITPLNKVTLNYGESIKLQAYPQYLPAGYGIRWSADSSCVELSVSANGRICTVTSVSTGGAAITAWIVDENGQKVTDKNGNVIKDTEVLYSEANVWLMIINFFKKLFGIDIG